MKICILRETKTPADVRVPLTPAQCRLVEEKFPEIKITVQPSAIRCFSDAAYTKEGIEVSDHITDCDLFLGVKEVAVDNLIPGKTYMFFSHTIKKQEHNKKLLRAILDKRIRLIDYELLTQDSGGPRIIGFGRWAGLIGSYLGIRAYCIRNGLPQMPHIREFSSFSDMATFAGELELPSFKTVITGDGRVGIGACEMMEYFRIRRIDAETYVNETFNHPVYTQLSPSLYNRRIDGSDFDLFHFFNHPGLYESDFEKYLVNTDVLISAAYWDPRAPLLFSKNRAHEPEFPIQVIADISCDLNGSIPTTLRTTSFEQPYYDYNRITGKVQDAFTDESTITVMSIDNLPCGLPAEASADFGQALISQVFPILAGEDPGQIIKRATIASDGHLNELYSYLQEWVEDLRTTLIK